MIIRSGKGAWKSPLRKLLQGRRSGPEAVEQLEDVLQVRPAREEQVLDLLTNTFFPVVGLQIRGKETKE